MVLPQKQNATNLGSNIQHPKQEETPSPKEEQEPIKEEQKANTPEADAKEKLYLPHTI